MAVTSCCRHALAVHVRLERFGVVERRERKCNGTDLSARHETHHPGDMRPGRVISSLAATSGRGDEDTCDGVSFNACSEWVITVVNMTGDSYWLRTREGGCNHPRSDSYVTA